MKDIKLAIGMVSAGSVKTKTVFALCRMIKSLKYDFNFIIKEGAILHWNREHIVKAAIENNCTHLLFVDTDMYFEPDAIHRLLAREKDIVGVHSHAKTISSTTTVHMDAIKKSRIKIDHPDGFLTCDAVGTGFMLINLDVFKHISEPWFFWESNDKGELVTGEDYWFCEKARKAGFDVWVDLTIPIKHIGDYFY